MKKPALRKRLGQHHLRHGELCRPVIEFLRPQDRLVMEVGPGGGLLTRELIEVGARVLAVEIDLAWTFLLHQELQPLSAKRSRAAPGGAPALVTGDALDLDWSRLPAGTLVTGNLPFHIATRLLLRLLPHGLVVPRAAFMVQREVGERLLARPGDAAYGALAVLVEACAEANLLARVKAGSFNPPPRVESVFVGFALHPPPFSRSELGPFQETVRLAFAQRRKTLFNSLAAGWGRGEAARVLRAVDLDRKCRAESLPLATFVRIHQARAERPALQ